MCAHSGADRGVPVLSGRIQSGNELASWQRLQGICEAGQRLESQQWLRHPHRQALERQVRRPCILACASKCTRVRPLFIEGHMRNVQVDGLSTQQGKCQPSERQEGGPCALTFGPYASAGLR